MYTYIQYTCTYTPFSFPTEEHPPLPLHFYDKEKLYGHVHTGEAETKSYILAQLTRRLLYKKDSYHHNRTENSRLIYCLSFCLFVLDVDIDINISRLPMLVQSILYSGTYLLCSSGGTISYCDGCCCCCCCYQVPVPSLKEERGYIIMIIYPR